MKFRNKTRHIRLEFSRSTESKTQKIKNMKKTRKARGKNPEKIQENRKF
jgi:hypothetical protein